MVVRQRRKKNKLRGNRTHGGGNTKNRRGSGCRGGRGRAGGHKHKFSKYWKDFTGKEPVLKPKKTNGITLNIEELQLMIPKLLMQKKAVQEKDFILIDGKKAGIVKILGKGNINEKIIFKNIKASKKVMEKIQKAGGKIEENEKNKNEASVSEKETEAKE